MLSFDLDLESYLFNLDKTNFWLYKENFIAKSSWVNEIDEFTQYYFVVLRIHILKREPFNLIRKISTELNFTF